MNKVTILNAAQGAFNILTLAESSEDCRLEPNGHCHFVQLSVSTQKSSLVVSTVIRVLKYKVLTCKSNTEFVQNELYIHYCNSFYQMIM